MCNVPWGTVKQRMSCFGEGVNQGVFTEEKRFELDPEGSVGVCKAEKGEVNKNEKQKP